MLVSMAITYYPHLWGIKRIRQLLSAGKITEKDYRLITGKEPMDYWE